jgi:hypothetical protein
MYETYLDSKNELYGQFFLYNNEMNNAGDPIKFKIYEDNNEKISKSFIGRPYVLPPKIDGRWDTKHVRADDLNDLLNKQKKRAAGEIVDVVHNEKTGNYNAVVKFFPEYYEQIKKGDIPEFTSPMFAHTDSHTDDEGRLHIRDGMGIHLQGVPAPGYPPELSSVKSVCAGGLDECMSELKMVAASGQLLESQSRERFSKEKIPESQSIMSMQEQQAAPPAAPQAGGDSEARIGALEKTVAELQKMLQELVSKLSGQQQAPPAAPPMAGAAGENASATVTETPEATSPEDQTTLVAELNQIKADRAVEKEQLNKEREALALQERTRVATEIVENKIKLHRLPLETRDVEIQKLVELKGADEQPADLTLLAAEIKETLKQFVGASGNFAELGMEEEQTDIDYIRTMESI